MPVALGLSVTGLLMAFGVGAAVLPDRLTGGGPEQTVSLDDPAQGTGGGEPGADVPDAPAPSSSASPSASPSPSKSASASPSPSKSSASPTPSRTTEKPAPEPERTESQRRAQSAPDGRGGQEEEVVRLVNAERAKAGCGDVRLDGKLRTAMRKHVEELGTHGDLYISHVSDDGRDFVQRAKAEGYDDPGGENVARGQRDAADVMNAWMNSEGHRANILNCDFKALGPGMAEGVDGTLVWGQLFGRS